VKQDALASQKYDRQVGDLLDALKVHKKAGEVALTAINKFSPEAKAFAKRLIKRVRAVDDKLTAALTAKPIPDDIAAIPDNAVLEISTPCGTPTGVEIPVSAIKDGIRSGKIQVAEYLAEKPDAAKPSLYDCATAAKGTF
jgi:hypothetical protein